MTMITQQAVASAERACWRKIEQELAAFFRREGAELDAWDGDVCLFVVAKHSPIVDLPEDEDVVATVSWFR
jgi:hypothetical protein